MVNTILRRKRFAYSYFEAFTKGFVLCCCRKRFGCIKESTRKRYKHIDKAKKMLKRTLDISEILKTVQRNQILLSAMLAPEQRLLLLYQRKNVIELRKDRADSMTSSSDEVHANFTKSIQNMIESRKPFDRMWALGRITHILK